MALTFLDAKKIPIVDYLSSLGIEPTKIRGHNFWYCSPIRGEKDPSFKVNNKLNLWYDHGSGEGGTLIDLGARLNSCTPSEFVNRLGDLHPVTPQFSLHRNKPKEPENKLNILSVDELRSTDLVEYLRGRGIDEDLAAQYCKQVSFEIANKNYLAVGFENKSGGFELRNNWFKGSSTPKDVSFIDNDSKKLYVVEGFMDFLSIEQLKSKTPAFGTDADFLILNSLSFLQRSESLIKAHETFLFLDNDQAGNAAKKNLHSNHVPFMDCCGFYAAHKDVNEYLVAQLEPAARRSVRI